MTNLEKYSEKIDSFIYANKKLGFHCAVKRVRTNTYATSPCLDLYCKDCKKDNIKWLLSECEPLELKNGDGLTMGQEIEVFREAEKEWATEKFIAYYKGLFLTVSGISPRVALGWERARLPQKEDHE